MTFRLTFGFDPGQTGAMAVLADEMFHSFADMPIMPRAAGGFHVNGAELAAAIRVVRATEPAATCFAVIEAVSAMPDQGVSGAFRFGEGYGVIRGVLGAMGIPFIEVHSSKWKRALSLHSKPKDAARTYAIQQYPAAAQFLKRKKDGGRADALLIASWAHRSEQQAIVPRSSAVERMVERAIADPVAFVGADYEAPAVERRPLIEAPE